ncbi:MDR family MFS transporter [Sporolactobacillus kofuensis]|uniref:MDR family MFS transporter n=1 Tax=Sporolactobacillus kofuensis TaxID=269672 RepID=A0ABW1WEH3_9BACL|nr:MDR family MFS transporter [Sporolactobacillus kofuensis]MCO7176250.1 MFS transporter [Sporolactobacillus kofuensis]
MKKNTNKTIVIAGLMIGTFLTAIEGTVVSTAMPKIIGDLQGIRIMDWVFSIFMLTSAVTAPLFGKLADLFGRKAIFLIGIILFLLGSVLCGLSWTMQAMIVFRGIQGIGAGAVMTLSTTIIGDIYPVEDRARMFGMIGLIWGIAGILGPLVGGFFVDVLSWHWIFFINLPFGIVTILLVFLGLHEDWHQERKKIDVTGALVFAMAMISLLLALQRIGEHGWHDSLTMMLIIASFLLLGLFLFIEQRAEDPMVPLTLLKMPIVFLTNLFALVASALLIGNDIYMPMWLQGLLGYSATASGFVLTPMSLAWMAGSFLCGHLLSKLGLRKSEVFGAILLIIGTSLMAMLRVDSNHVIFYLLATILGLGFGITLTLTTIAAQSATDHRMRGVITASNQFFRSIGQTIGAAFFGMYFNTQATHLIAEKNDDSVTVDQLNALVHPQGHDQLHASLLNVLREVLNACIHNLFVVFFILALITGCIAMLLPKYLPNHSNQNV